MRRLLSFLVPIVFWVGLPAAEGGDHHKFAVIHKLQGSLTPILTEPSFPTFTTSSEILIGRAKPILDQANKGLYLGIGSDRSFRAAALAPRINFLLLVDISPRIVRYNRINTELLKEDRLEDYLWLRRDATYRDWELFAIRARRTSKVKVNLTESDFLWWEANVRDMEAHSYYPLPEMLNRFGRDILIEPFLKIRNRLEEVSAKMEKNWRVDSTDLFFSSSLETWNLSATHAGLDIKFTQEEWDWWKKYVGNGVDYAYCQEWAKNPETTFNYGAAIPYKYGHYFFDKKLYQKLHFMAVENRITSLLIDLTSQEDLALLAQAITKSRVHLSVIDLGNSYEDEYMGDERYREAITTLRSAGDRGTILLAMKNYLEFGSGQFSVYVGFQAAGEKVTEKGFQMSNFFAQIPKEIVELMNGLLIDDLGSSNLLDLFSPM